MSSIFSPYLHKLVKIYLDDILAYNDNEHDHVLNARRILDILRRSMLYAKKSKCTFGFNETEYLGFILKGDGIDINPHKA